MIRSDTGFWVVSDSDFSSSDETLARLVAREFDKDDPLPPKPQPRPFGSVTLNSLPPKPQIPAVVQVNRRTGEPRARPTDFNSAYSNDLRHIRAQMRVPHPIFAVCMHNDVEEIFESNWQGSVVVSYKTCMRCGRRVYR